MRATLLASCLAAALGAAFPGPARACGFAEAPSGCGEADAEREAKWMLSRVVTAIQRDKTQALRQFAKGEGGFRTADTYVFCVGPDGIMSAHPSAILQGQDVRELHDETNNYFIRTMMETAKAGQVQQIRYLFPRPGSTQATPKTTFYTLASDQVCGVGYYEGGEDRPAATASVEDRVQQLRRRLDQRIPAELRGDWTAYTEALNEEAGARQALLAKVRENVQAVQTALGPNASSTAR